MSLYVPYQEEIHPRFLIFRATAHPQWAFCFSAAGCPHLPIGGSICSVRHGLVLIFWIFGRYLWILGMKSCTFSQFFASLPLFQAKRSKRLKPLSSAKKFSLHVLVLMFPFGSGMGKREKKIWLSEQLYAKIWGTAGNDWIICFPKRSWFCMA